MKTELKELLSSIRSSKKMQIKDKEILERVYKRIQYIINHY